MVSITLRLSGSFWEKFVRPGDAWRPYFRRLKFRIIFFSLRTLRSRSSSPTSAESPSDRISLSPETPPAQSKPLDCRGRVAEGTAIGMILWQNDWFWDLRIHQPKEAFLRSGRKIIPGLADAPLIRRKALPPKSPFLSLEFWVRFFQEKGTKEIVA